MINTIVYIVGTFCILNFLKNFTISFLAGFIISSRSKYLEQQRKLKNQG